MADDHSYPPQPGGFLPPTGLPSPSPSAASSSRPGGAGSANTLPHPRPVALHPGSSKEDMVRRYVEDRLMYTSRRYVKKFGNPDPGDTVVGFRAFGEVCKELDGVVNVLWLSGTPSLQIPFLLKLASDFTQYVRSFPPAPKATFSLLGKLDHCFASLLCGQDVESRETLPGFDNGLRSGMTVTDMVRCRSLVEQTRVLMVEIMSTDRGEEDDDEDEREEDDDEFGHDSGSERGAAAAVSATTSWDIDEERLHLDAARIYENTIVQLGNRLGDGSLAMSL